MSTQSYLCNDIRPLSPDHLVKEAQMLFNQLPYTHLPVVRKGKLLGNIFEEDLKSWESEDTLEAHRYSLDHFFVKEHTNWLDVLEVLAQNEATVIPVLNSEERYMGYYVLTDILSFFNETPFLNEPGNIVIVEKPLRDYSFSEIAQIVESNNGRILGAFISEFRGEMAQITMKMGNRGLQDSLQAFRRYGYAVVSSNDEDIYEMTLKERSAYLKRYLDI